MEIFGFAQFGYEGELVKVEADLRRGIPAVDVVGLPDGAIRESRERMRAAIRNSGLEFPKERILLNLCPAGLKKEGSSFDLPIALSVLGSAEGLTACEGQVMVLGELELSGTVRPVPGTLAAVSCGVKAGITHFLVPAGNYAEAALVPKARIQGVESLAQAVGMLRTLAANGTDRENQTDAGDKADTNIDVDDRADADDCAASRDEIDFDSRPRFPLRFPDLGDLPGFEDIRGQRALVRALQIAAAGGHHLIAYGPPGCGKTMTLRRFPALLPNLGPETALEATRIHGIAETLSREGPALITRPPFREPHPNASLEGLIGGGLRCSPGEISLAHGGTLFLDEAALFRASALQALRSPIESGTVTLSRAGKNMTFPSRFQLLMAINPCPCGNAGAPGRVCTCMPDSVNRYWKRMTAPLLDRIDLRIEVRPPEGSELAGPPIHSTAELRIAVARARVMQRERNQEGLNGSLVPEALMRSASLSLKAHELFRAIMADERLSGRGGHGILRVARTIADMEGSKIIEAEHLQEASGFRKWGIAVPDFL